MLSIGSFILFSFLAFYIKGRRTLARTATPRSFADSEVSQDEEQNNANLASLDDIPSSSRPLVQRRNQISPTLVMMFNLGEVEKYFPKVENVSAINRKTGVKKKCSLCMLDLGNGLPVRKIITCGDHFHAKCLMDHLDSNNTCPDCRFLLTKNNLDDKIKEISKKKRKIKVATEQNEQVGKKTGNINCKKKTTSRAKKAYLRHPVQGRTNQKEESLGQEGNQTVNWMDLEELQTKILRKRSFLKFHKKRRNLKVGQKKN